jgi:hypothetical protein
MAGDFMAISHELSSEIATALFAAKERSPHELNDLKEIVFEIHSTLERLSDEERAARVSHAGRNDDYQAGSLSALRAKSARQNG